MNLIKEALLTVTPHVYHNFAQKKADKYIVWAEDGQGDSLHGDNGMVEQVIQGTIDYYTKDEKDPNVKRIQDALTAHEIAFRLNSIQFEEETGYAHYEWVWEVE